MPKPGDVAGVASYVLKQAPRYQLDPNAVVAVALQEGLLTKGGAPGDNGTSFGPWQLHQGGAYPASAPQTKDAANAWAWSDAGINYALGRMQSVAGGMKGRQAVKAIVYRFERPADPATEYQNAVQALPASDGGPAGGPGPWGLIKGIQVGPVPGVTVGTATGAAGAAASGAEAVASFLGHLTDPKYLLRGLEVAGGAFFVLLGLYVLGRQAGVVDRATGAVGSVAQVIPEARLAREARLTRRAAAASHPVHVKARQRAALDEKYGAEAPF